MSHSARGVPATDRVATGVGDLVPTSLGLAGKDHWGWVYIRHLWERKNRDEVKECNSILTDVSFNGSKLPEAKVLGKPV